MSKRYHINALFQIRILCAFVLQIVFMTASGCSEQTKVGFELDDTDVPSALFTPDSKYIVAGGYRKISLLDIHSRQFIDRFPEDKRDLGGAGARSFEIVAASPDGKYIASAGMGVMLPVRIWDLQTGKLVRSFDTRHTEVRAIAFSPDSKQLVAAAACRFHGGPKPYEPIGELWLWNIEQDGDEPIRFFEHEAPVESVAFSADSTRIFSINTVHVIRVWDVASQKQLKQSAKWTPPPRSRLLPIGSRFDGIEEGASFWLGNLPRPGLSLRLSADGKHLIIGRSVWDAEDLRLDYFVDDERLWKDLDEWRRVNQGAPGDPDGIQRYLLGRFSDGLGALTQNNRSFVCCDGGNIMVFDTTTGSRLLKDQVYSNGASAFTLDVSSDGRYALAGGDGTASAGGGGAPLKRDPNQLYLYRLPLPSATTDKPQSDHREEGKIAPQK